MPSPPRVLIRTTPARQTVVVVSPDAGRLGVRPGMPLTQARAVCPDLLAEEHDPAADARALVALARWAQRFSPVVVVDHPDALLIDLTGTERCLGPTIDVARRTYQLLTRMGLTVRLAVAPTPAAAWAIASAGKNGTLVQNSSPSMAASSTAFGMSRGLNPGMSCGGGVSPPLAPKERDTAAIAASDRPVGPSGGETQSGGISPPLPPPQFGPQAVLDRALAPLPVAALRLAPGTADQLHRLGITSIGQLRALPREQLPARFGPELLERLDLATGRLPQILVPTRLPEKLSDRIEFEGVVSAIETVHAAVGQLAGHLTAALRAQGRGARKLTATFERPYLSSISRDVLLTRPSRDAHRWAELLRHVAEEVPFDDGFTAIGLAVPEHDALADEQTDFLGLRSPHDDALAELVDSLSARLGADVLHRPVPIESHVPELSVRYAPVAEPPDGHRSAALLPEADTGHRRPLTLLPVPREVRVMVAPHDDREGRPVAVHDGPRQHRILTAAGPRRIAGRWWDGHLKTRDYYDAQDDRGRHLWLFRVRENDRWFLQGEF